MAISVVFLQRRNRIRKEFAKTLIQSFLQGIVASSWWKHEQTVLVDR